MLKDSVPRSNVFYGFPWIVPIVSDIVLLRASWLLLCDKKIRIRFRASSFHLIISNSFIKKRLHIDGWPWNQIVLKVPYRMSEVFFCMPMQIDSAEKERISYWYSRSKSISDGTRKFFWWKVLIDLFIDKFKFSAKFLVPVTSLYFDHLFHKSRRSVKHFLELRKHFASVKSLKMSK